LSCRLAQIDIPDGDTELGKLDNAKEGNLKELEVLETKLLQKLVSTVNLNTGELQDDPKRESFETALNR
jgi:hypothetical protein